MVDYDFQSRFQVSQVPPAAPGTCCACSTFQGPFISLGRTVKFVGLLVLCKGCVQHIAEQFGLFTQEETDLLVATTTGFSDGFEAGKDFTTHELRTYLDSLDSPSDSASGASAGVEDADGIPEDDADASGDLVSTTPSSEPSNVSASKRRRADVPLTSVDLSL